jgi:hypothetical protein
VIGAVRLIATLAIRVISADLEQASQEAEFNGSSCYSLTLRCITIRHVRNDKQEGYPSCAFLKEFRTISRTKLE